MNEKNVMKPMAQVANTALEWLQPNALERRFELRAGNDLVATLEWDKPFGTLATARTAEAEWTLKRSGFFNPHVSSRVSGSDTDIATFRPNFLSGDGLLDLHDGRTFKWKASNFWRTKWRFEGASGQPLISLKPEHKGLGDLFKFQAEVEIEPGALAEPGLLLALVFGWYMMVMLHEEASSGAAAATGI